MKTLLKLLLLPFFLGHVHGAVVSRASVKSLFETGDEIVQSSFDNAWDSTLFAEDINTLAKLNAYLGDATLVDGSAYDITTFAKLDAIVADVSMAHLGLFDTYNELNTIVADTTLLHSGSVDTFSELDALVLDKSLVNTADAYTAAGIPTFSSGVVTDSISTTPTGLGVNVEGVTFYDGGLTATASCTFNNVVTFGLGMVVSDIAIFNGPGDFKSGMFANTIEESTLNAGTTIEGTKMIDSTVCFDPVIAPVHTEGKLFYDNTDKTLSIYTDISGVSLQVGEEVRTRITNKSGALISNGEVVYVDGAFSGQPTVELADATVPSTANKTLGVATHDIANDADGYITTHGLVRGLNLSAFSAGDTVYLSTTAGGLVAAAPASPNANVRVGTILSNSATEGILFVQVEPTQEAQQLYGILSTQANVTAETTTDATPRKIASWNTNGITGGLTVDHTDDTIQVPVAGTYEVQVSCSFLGSASDEYQVEIYYYDDSAASWVASGFAFDRLLNTGGDVGNGFTCALLTLDVDDKIAVYHSSSTGGVTFTAQEAQMTVKRIAD